MPPGRHPSAAPRCACPVTAGMAAKRALDALTLVLAATWLLALSGSACSTHKPAQQHQPAHQALDRPEDAWGGGPVLEPTERRSESPVGRTTADNTTSGTTTATTNSTAPSTAGDALPGRTREAARIRAVKASVLAALHMAEPPSPEVVARARASLTLEDMARAFRKYDQAVLLAQTDSEARIPRRGSSQTRSVHPVGRRAHHHRPTGFKRAPKHSSRHSRPVTLFFSSEWESGSQRQPADVLDGVLRLYFSPLPARAPTGHRRRSTRRPPRSHGQRKKTVTCSVYLLQTGNKTKGALAGPGETYLLDSKVLPLATSGWQSFLVTAAVQAWLDEPSRELSLLVDVEGRPAEELFYLQQGSPMLSRLEPRVEVAYRPPGVAPAATGGSVFSRDRRQAGTAGANPGGNPGGGRQQNCRSGDGVTTCCRYEQNISFLDLGWETWILQPTSYDSFQCSGECPTEYRPATAYSRIKSLMHDIDPDTWSPPCCAPTLFSSTPYMYLNRNGGINITVITDAVVQECHCL